MTKEKRLAQWVRSMWNTLLPSCKHVYIRLFTRECQLLTKEKKISELKTELRRLDRKENFKPENPKLDANICTSADEGGRNSVIYDADLLSNYTNALRKLVRNV